MHSFINITIINNFIFFYVVQYFLQIVYENNI